MWSRLLKVDIDIVCIGSGIEIAKDPYDLYEFIDVEGDIGHAFYLGLELARAQIAYQLGKEYEQDEELKLQLQNCFGNTTFLNFFGNWSDKLTHKLEKVAFLSFLQFSRYQSVA